MLLVSTAWNVERCGGWAAAAGELVQAGFSRIALDGPVLHPDAATAGRVVRERKGQIPVLFAPAPRPGSASPAGAVGLVSPVDETRAVALATAETAALRAADAGAGLVVLRPGAVPCLSGGDDMWDRRLKSGGATDALMREVRDTVAEADDVRPRFLDALCRSLHHLGKARPDVTWLLETPRSPLGVPSPAEAELVFDDLKGRRLGLWHHPGHAARWQALCGVDPGEWLDRLGSHGRGLTLSDWSPTGGGLPPGSGVVDWKGLLAQSTDRMLRVVCLDPSFPPPLLRDAVREARRLGF